jgi:NAD(P)-dependent dehydrogenase (short-subunit alcohol dehydrogenase family)
MQKVAVITAGGSGMGAAAARRLAADGFAVAILSSSGKGEALATELGGVGITGCGTKVVRVHPAVRHIVLSRNRVFNEIGRAHV